MTFAGIDYGAKLAGTTVMAICMNKSIHLLQSKKNEDADEFVKKMIEQQNIHSVFIDAPLSLPIVYRGETVGGEYFYRECDKECKAMSPMFLGGLTARAMKLRYDLSEVTFTETYPSQLIKILEIEIKSLGLKKAYSILKKYFDGYAIMDDIQNKHQFDAMCALLSHIRYNEGKAQVIGNLKEGTITI
jgi:predicted nuclease with RNAse H fold